MTLRGWGNFEWNGRTQRVPEDHAFIAIVPEDSRYYYPEDSDETWEFSWVNFGGRQGIEIWSWFRDRFGGVVPMGKSSPAREIFNKLIRETSRNGALDEFQLSGDAYRLVMAWAGQLEERYSPSPAMDEVVRQMKYRPGSPLVVKELAARAGVSREHFSRMFLKKTGMSPARYRRELQLGEVEEWLARSDLSVGEIALQSGFASGRQLAKVFRRDKGQTPSEYRQKIRNETRHAGGDKSKFEGNPDSSR